VYHLNNIEDHLEDEKLKHGVDATIVLSRHRSRNRQNQLTCDVRFLLDLLSGMHGATSASVKSCKL